MKNSLIVFLFFVLGIIFGIWRFLPDFLLQPDWTTIVLYFLLFLIGVALGGERDIKRLLSQTNIKILLVPAGIIIGTLGGSLIASFLFVDLSGKETMAVGAGFGWYSFSSLIISSLHSEQLGVIALMSNLIREIVTLLFTPFFVNYFGKFAGIASGGATSMDVTLPIILRYSGKEFALVSMASGLVLSFAVPVLVTWLLS